MSETIPTDLGQKPELMWVDIDKIAVDHNYQRELKANRVAQILREFNWAHFQPVMLAEQPDGTFTVFDGQHRVAAARSHPRVKEVPAAVIRVSGSKEEAGAFLGVNVNRTAVTTVEKFWAGVEAEDKAMLRVRDVLAKAGCEVQQALGIKPAAHKTGAVTAVERSIRMFGEAAVADACRSLVKAWPSDGKALSGIFIQAVARLYRNNKAVVTPERLEAKLRSTDRKTLALQAETLRKLGGGDAALNLCKAIVEIYNKGLQLNQIQIGAKA
jgi:hypothetical protein